MKIQNCVLSNYILLKLSSATWGHVRVTKWKVKGVGACNNLILKVPRDFTRSRRPFCKIAVWSITTCDCNNQRDWTKQIVSDFDVCNQCNSWCPTQSGARTSAGTEMTKITDTYIIYMESIIQELISPLNNINDIFLKSPQLKIPWENPQDLTNDISAFV